MAGRGGEVTEVEVEEPAVVLDPDLRSPDPSVCPFFRSVSTDGSLAPPVAGVDPANACVATGRVEAQGGHQQRSLCLTSAHVGCPRYLTGTSGVSTVPAPAVPAAGARLPQARPRSVLTPAVIAAAIFLVTATATAIGFVGARGGLALPQWSGPPLAAASLPVASAAPTIVPSAASPAATEVTSATSAPEPTIEPPATPAPTSSPVPAPTATPTTDRFALLVACPGKPDCYIYTIRVGDNLLSITRWFGVPYDTVLALNPWITDPMVVRAGDKLTIPTPTR